MRTAQKKQIEACVDLLANAHQTIEYALRKKQPELAIQLLDHCQQNAVCASSVIEALEGTKDATGAFSEYCDTVFRVYEMLTQNNSINVREMQNMLQMSLEKIKACVQQLKARREVVFLPYKASMWDSLESVWKAADEDPDCDAYVVPIPYYDKNPIGDLSTFHYEGDLYPDYVPVYDYRTFDLAERKPDIIFIHNPYDECNYVTSIHPAFYSQELKKYTDKLVYIPYFVLGEINPEIESEVEGIAHFCTVPGVLNADKVIVQSEAMRQAYIKVLTNFVKRSNRAYWEKRILGLGSPKLDKVNSVTQADVEIPEEWKPILYKPDGSRRKVIFYNTSVSSLLEHNERMLTKMRDVFRVFYENREEVALLWRPHPLIKATIESMRPDLWREYERLVAEYREAGWGIYDDSSDLNRAIAVSDAYYGDPSSVVQLCKENGMPVMLQVV